MSQSGGYVYEPRAWWGDEDVQMMTYEVQGMYRRLLDHQFENGDIPEDPERLAAILSIGVNQYTAESIAPLLAPLLAPFVASPDSPGRLMQPRMHRERQEWREKQEFYREKGKEGARKRWKKKTSGRKAKKDGPPNGPPNGPPIAGKVRKGKLKDPPVAPRSRKWDSEASEIFAHYKARKLRWYQILAKKPPKEPELTEPDRVAIVSRLKDGYSVERLKAALDNVEHDAWLMGKSERSKRHQLSLTTVLLVRTNGQVPLNRVEQLLDKTEPDGAMKSMIAAVDGRLQLVAP